MELPWKTVLLFVGLGMYVNDDALFLKHPGCMAIFFKHPGCMGIASVWHETSRAEFRQCPAMICQTSGSHRGSGVDLNWL